MAPVSGSGQPAKSPRFDPLSCLVDRNHTHNLIGRLDNGHVAPQQKAVGNTGTAKRKPADTSNHASRARRRSPAVGATPTSSLFVQPMTESKTPAGVCASGWRGQNCERALCMYDRDWRHPDVRPPHSQVPRPLRSRLRRQHLHQWLAAPPPLARTPPSSYTAGNCRAHPRQPQAQEQRRRREWRR